MINFNKFLTLHHNYIYLVEIQLNVYLELREKKLLVLNLFFFIYISTNIVAMQFTIKPYHEYLMDKE